MSQTHVFQLWGSSMVQRTIFWCTVLLMVFIFATHALSNHFCTFLTYIYDIHTYILTFVLFILLGKRSGGGVEGMYVNR